MNEPVLLGAAVRAVIFAAGAFGFQMTTEQLAAVMGALEAVLLLLTRALVTPNQLAEARVQAAIDDPARTVTAKTATTPAGPS